MFTMYYTTSMSRYMHVRTHGATPMPPKFGSMWSPKGSVIYLQNSLDTARDFAIKAYTMKKTDSRAFAIFKTEMAGEFPGNLFQDYDWGLAGVYYTPEPIPPGKLEFVERYVLWPIPPRAKRQEVRR